MRPSVLIPCLLLGTALVFGAALLFEAHPEPVDIRVDAQRPPPLPIAQIPAPVQAKRPAPSTPTRAPAIRTPIAPPPSSAPAVLTPAETERVRTLPDALENAGEQDQRGYLQRLIAYHEDILERARANEAELPAATGTNEDSRRNEEVRRYIERMEAQLELLRDRLDQMSP